jgi:pyruvate ferredoxin oxidoreductase beta subunit
MQNYTVYVPNLISKEELFSAGHRACQGCGLALAVRYVLKALGKNVIISNATGCLEIISSPLPYTSWGVPWIHVAFENVAAVAAGVELALKVLMRKGKIPQKKIHCLALAGDGGTADIGLQALSGALERGHDFLYICFDNEAYMNTGIQRSGATPFGAHTTTSPASKIKPGQTTWKKNMPAICAAHNIPYVATANPSYPFDFMDKVRKAAEVEGPAYIHALAVCPTGWRHKSDDTIFMGRLATETGMFPVYEVIDGKYKISVDFEKLRPVSEYLKLQGRFRHLKEKEINFIQERVIQEFEHLKKLEKLSKL